MPNAHHDNNRNGRQESSERNPRGANERSAGGRSEGYARQRDAEQRRAGYSARDWEREDWSRNTRSEPDWDPERNLAHDTRSRWEEERLAQDSPRYDRNEFGPPRPEHRGGGYGDRSGLRPAVRWYEGSEERGRPDWGPDPHREPEGFSRQLEDAGRRLLGKVKRLVRNPKNYRRSDERIREDVCDRLSVSPEVDPVEVEVSVANGEVTLTGTVPTRHMKFCAEQIADDVPGVHDVHNQLRITWRE